MIIPQRQRWVVLATLLAIVLIAGVILAGYWILKPRTVVVLLQNHHELRSTGGFLGSLLEIKTAFPQPVQWKVYDIYSLAGTSTLDPDSPVGHREYLSGGHGLQLADANWWPDFAYSSQIITQFLRESIVGEPDLLVYINTQVFQTMLEVVGPIPLPDYQTTLQADNIFTTIFTARGEFFAGSAAKSSVLNHVTTQLAFRLRKLSLSEWKAVWHTGWAQVENNNIAAWSPHPFDQRIIRQLNLDGSMGLDRLSPKSTLYLFPVESNVGVNKTNAGISRHLQLTSLTATTSALTITWKNNNPATTSARPELIRPPGAAGADHTHYANYLRIYTLPATRALSLRSDSDSVTNFTESSFTASNGGNYNEIGLFVPVLAESSTSITLTLAHQPHFQIKHIYLPRQAGLTSTSYYINFHRAQTNGSLNQDLIWRPSVQ